MFPRITASIRGKLLLLIAAVTCIALLVSGVALLIYEAHNYHERWVSDLETQADILGASSAAAIAFDDRKTAAENLELLRARPAIVAAAVYAEDGVLFAAFARDRVPRVPPRLETASLGVTIEHGHIKLLARIGERNAQRGFVYLVATYGLTERVLSYAGILATVMLLSLLAAVLIGWWFERRITEPIVAVAETAHRVIETRDFSLRVDKKTSDEVAYLVEAFNSMLAEIDVRSRALIDADRMKDQFLATLAHELRNPLAPISNALHILRGARGRPELADRAQGMIERQVRQMVRLVDDLMDVSRITTGKLTLRLEHVSLSAVVSNAIDLARPAIEAKDHQLTVALPPEPIALSGDPTRLAQVFSNLLNNAAKYTQRAGRIEMTARHDGEALAVQVTDNGIGIAPEVLPRIFDMFTQADTDITREHQSGLGVGLTLAKRLVELHGGTIEAHSPGLDRGSTFVVRLPRVVQSAAPDAGSGSFPRADGLDVVVVDDNVDFAQSLRVILEDLGSEVRIAYDGRAGIREIERHVPDLAFVDIGLPHVSGYDVARSLRAAGYRSLVLVAVTGWGQPDDRSRSAAAGFDAHLVKPLDPAQLAPIFELARKRTAPPEARSLREA